MIMDHDDLLLVVKHVEMGQTPQKLKQSHDYGTWRPAFSCITCGKGTNTVKLKEPCDFET